MRNILAKQGEMTQLGNFFPFEQLNLAETWSGDAQALYVCKLPLELRNQHVCGRRKSRISGNWWAISAIREVLLLLPLNHWANFFALCGNMVPIHPSKMPAKPMVPLYTFRRFVEPSASLRSASGSPCTRSVVLWNHRLRFAQPLVPPVHVPSFCGFFWHLETLWYCYNNSSILTVFINVYIYILPFIEYVLTIAFLRNRCLSLFFL